jgi:Transposase DDE domain
MIGLTKGGQNSRLHAVTDALSHPIRVLLSRGNRSDYKGALALLPSLPKAKWLFTDRDHDADLFCNELKGKEINPYIP